jgi:hypothetical protein
VSDDGGNLRENLQFAKQFDKRETRLSTGRRKRLNDSVLPGAKRGGKRDGILQVGRILNSRCRR